MQWESVRLAFCPVDGIVGNFFEALLRKISKRSRANFCHGREESFINIKYFFDFELNQPWFAGLQSERSPTVLAGPGKQLNFIQL